MSAEVVTRAVTRTDHAQWSRLYRGYRDFYRQAEDQQAIDTVWSWLLDSEHETRGLVAERDGALVALAHFRTFARPLSASHGLFLDDLFTAPEARGSGAATMLLDHLSTIARDEGATVVRWITAEDNATARRLYDQQASVTPWVTYDLAPAADA